MNILLISAGEIASIIGTMVIGRKAQVDAIIEIAKKGYKIDQKKFLEINDNEIKGFDVSKSKKTAGNILLFIPGVNLLWAGYGYFKLKKDLMESPEIKNALIPMTVNEKEQFAKIKDKKEQLVFSMFIMCRDVGEEEFVGYIDGTLYTQDNGLNLSPNQMLTPLAYSLDEVKKLNKVSNFSYKVGKFDGRNLAIIGIPDSDYSLKKLHIINGMNMAIGNFKEMSEEEAQNKKFTVYQFTLDKKENIDKAIDEIVQSRNVNRRSNDFNNAEENVIKFQEYPTLKRTLYQKKF